MSYWEYSSLPDLSYIVETQPIKLDTDSRVKGICQLMDQVILDIEEIPIYSYEDVNYMIKQFDEALNSLDRYLLTGNSFLRKYRDKNKIGEEEMRKYMSIIKKKRREVIKLLISYFTDMGLPQVKKRVNKKAR
jgi:hypothetical protein